MRHCILISLLSSLAINTYADEPSRYSIVCDPDSSLCWQDPQKDAYRPDVKGLNAAQAAQYCDELVLANHSDCQTPMNCETLSMGIRQQSPKVCANSVLVACRMNLYIVPARVPRRLKAPVTRVAT